MRLQLPDTYYYASHCVQYAMFTVCTGCSFSQEVALDTKIIVNDMYQFAKHYIISEGSFNLKKDIQVIPVCISSSGFINLKELFILCIAACNSTNLVIEILQLYGSEQTLYCGDSDPNTPPGDWYHDGAPLRAYRSSYTISNANFSDDGEYQCRRNETNVLPSPLQVDVYGKS